MPVGDTGDEAALLHAVALDLDAAGAGAVAIAVSGGGDSIALLHLARQAAATSGRRIAAVTVDHGLRAGSADEAAAVGRTCAALGISHAVLVWQHDQVAGNLMDQARRARYRLIGDWARGQDIGHVMLGHTADDQAETFLMGLAREAGIDGLSGMRRSWHDKDLLFSRPLLGFGRESLRHFLVRNGIGWIDDPTNEDPGFARIKARRALRLLGPLGITPAKLANVTAHLDMARDAVNFALASAASTVAREEAGALVLDRPAVLALPTQIQRQLIIAALRWVSSAEYPPRGAAIDRFRTTIRQTGKATLWGCALRATDAELRIVREPKAVAGVAARTDALWDGRWRLIGPHAPGLEIRALGAPGLALCRGWQRLGIGRDALVVTPAIWQGERLLAAPLAGLANGWDARITASFGRAIVSH